MEEPTTSNLQSKRPCLTCRKSKVRCDRGGPCGRCVRLDLVCTEQEKAKRGGPPARQHRKGSGNSRSKGTGGGGSRSSSKQHLVDASNLLSVAASLLASADQGAAVQHAMVAVASAKKSKPRIKKEQQQPPRLFASSSQPAATFYSCGRQLSIESSQSGMTSIACGEGKVHGLPPHLAISKGFSLTTSSSDVSLDSAHEKNANKTVTCNSGSPLQTIVSTFMELHNQARVSKAKTFAVMRAWASSAVQNKMEPLARGLTMMSNVLGIEWKTLLSDHEAVREADQATKGMKMQARSFHPDDLDPFVKDLYSEACAALVLISVDGRTRFVGNTLFTHDFADVENYNASLMTAAESSSTPFDILGSVIHHDDQREFFESISAMLFNNPRPCTEISHIIKAINRRGEPVVTLARVRCLLSEGGGYLALVINLQRLPTSRYLASTSLATSASDGSLSTVAGGGDDGEDMEDDDTTNNFLLPNGRSLPTLNMPLIGMTFKNDSLSDASGASSSSSSSSGLDSEGSDSSTSSSTFMMLGGSSLHHHSATTTTSTTSGASASQPNESSTTSILYQTDPPGCITTTHEPPHAIPPQPSHPSSHFSKDYWLTDEGAAEEDWPTWSGGII